MATLISQTQWHGNPRPVEAYTSTIEDGLVASPYYLDGRNVAVHAHVVSSIPLGDLAPAASIVVPGPDLVVSGDVDGIWTTGSALNIAITVTGGTNISTAIANGKPAMGPDEFASEVASALNTIGAGDVQCGSTGNVVNISALGAVSALTITTWAAA